MAAANEELNASNEELFNEREELQASINKMHETQNKLIQAEKMASLGILSAGMPHKINMSKKVTLLYVDDEPINTMLFEANFYQNYCVLTAESGFKGLNKLKLNPEISGVISDMKMPEMNGIQFIREAKKEYSNIKYFLLSGYDLTV